MFATRHGKQHQAAGPFRELLDARVVAPDDLDTDRFGSFTGEVPRTRTPLLDDDRGVVLTEEAVVPVHGHDPVVLRDPADALERARRFGFPDTRAVVVARHGGDVHARKGLATAADLADAVTDLTTTGGTASVGPDLRAHVNPARQRVIAELCRRMATRLTRPCPRYAAPGWGRVGVERGVPCAGCGAPTTAVAADVLGCAGCDATQVVPRRAAPVDPASCDVCNP